MLLTLDKSRICTLDFEGTNNDFLRKAADINAHGFYEQQNWTFVLFK